MAVRFQGTRRGGLRRFSGHAFGVAAVVTVTLVGNLRVQASEVAQQVPVTSAAAVAATDARADWRVSTVGEAAASRAPDAVELVPAIYAWNPDVRFVYFRHVSKWM